MGITIMEGDEYLFTRMQLSCGLQGIVMGDLYGEGLLSTLRWRAQTFKGHSLRRQEYEGLVEGISLREIAVWVCLGRPQNASC